ncbi:hypothetical protein MIZ03_0787 [Rhodoferax lithotrophicus]|uniref:Uncharacterized protein n=1 Tax=Rhodoferax lithotrophicus TaxID=2798804 RepID=A0ABM7MI51_9BURK|nr:hypothetical protein MIZ03_0787 [Rhodoferax sp. MIZ03]
MATAGLRGAEHHGTVARKLMAACENFEQKLLKTLNNKPA